MAERPPIRYVQVMLMVPEECAEEFREFFAREKTGQVELLIAGGKVLGTDCHSQKRARPRDKVL